MAPKRGRNNKKGGKTAPKTPKTTTSPKITKTSETPKTSKSAKTPKIPKTPTTSKTPKTPKSSKPKKTSEDGQRNVLEVDWAVPKAKRRDVPDQKHIDDYAHALYNRQSDELQPVQAALPEAQIRVPIYQKKGGKDMQAGDANQSSRALRNLYNNIKDRSVNEQNGHHDIATLTEHFVAGGDNTVVILSNAEHEEVLVLDEDRRLQVTVNGRTAHIDFIRRAPASEENQALGYFIELPQGISVTVNGITYTNNGANLPIPFYIGPLQGYVVVELLSQPAFFFRHEESLKYTITTRRVTSDELGRRDHNGDVSVDNVTVRWLAVEQEDDTESDVIHVQVNQPRVERVQPTEEHRPEEAEYSDAFTDDGQPIGDVCAYVQNSLKIHTKNRIASIIPRVIASINSRQSENAGFSFVHNDTFFRPGRTLITALTDCGRYLLVVGQIQPDTSIRIRTLYPRTWRSHKNHRDRINEDLRNWFMRTDWWRNAFDSHEQMVARLPKDIEWAPCAQTPTQEGTFTYTILNAWALVLGLEPDPTFTPSRHGDEAFFIKAERIFDLALSDSLTWKVLLAFLRCTGFVKLAATVEGENNEDAELPATNRRFDLRKCSFEALVAEQARADQEFSRKNQNTEQLGVRLEEGILHSATFASDPFTEEMRDMLIQLVRAGDWRLHDTVEQFKRKLEKLADESEYSSSTGSSLDISLIEDLQSDELAVPKNFNPCRHLDGFVRQEELFYYHAKKEQPQATEVPKLSNKHIQDSIAAVVRAVNRRHPPGAGFTTRSSTTEVKSSINDNEDSISVFMYMASNDHELCVMVQKTTDVASSCTIIDSNPLVTNKDARTKIRKHLRKELSATGPILWISGPQQALEYHSGYHVVLNAWSIVLGLPLNIQGFKSSHKFIKDAYVVIQTVLQDEVSWSVVWALLRCYGYVASPEAPAPERRFAKTMPSREHEVYVSEMKSKKVKATTDAKVSAYEYFQSDSIRQYGESIDWDETYPEDGIAGFSELQPSDYTESMVSPGGNQKEQPQPNQNDAYTRDGITGFSELQPSEFTESMVSFSEIQPDHTQQAEEFEPCKYLRNTLSALLAEENIQKELKILREGGVTKKKGDWLHDEEVALATDAVLMAINEMQDLEEGFSVVPSYTMTMIVQAKGKIKDEGLVARALRPGRPFIAPVVYNAHIVLLVAQFDGKGFPTISILDSFTPNYSPQDRKELFTIAWQLLYYTSWWRNVFPDDSAFTRVKPATAAWVRTACQPSYHECGYFTVLNAWALALGLELNPGLRLAWTDELFQQVRDVIHLARIGCVDWKLIFALLRCHRFVQDGVVPKSRRFGSTYQTKTATEFGNALAHEIKREDAHWTKHKYNDGELQRIRSCNHVPDMVGKPHNSKFTSDELRRDKKNTEKINELLRFQLFDPDLTEKQVREMSSNVARARLEKCKKKLRSATPSSENREVLIETILEEVNRQYKGMDAEILRNPANWADDTIDLYDEFMKDVKVQKILGTSHIMRQGDWRRILEDSELNLAMASVLEAIDALQSDLHAKAHPKAPFAGGFSLTTSIHLQLALNDEIGDESKVLSRPRRAWLFPLVVHRESLLPKLEQWVADYGITWEPPLGRHGHSFLVLVQEVRSDELNSGDSVVEIQVLDSRFRIFEEVVAFFGERIEDAARRLGWLTHRNHPVQPPTDPELYLRDEIPQQIDNVSCGHHVLINAWMIAMGLHVNNNAQFNKEIYQQLYTLSRAAVAGILDWKTLATWFFSHNLTKETKFSQVPVNRRFSRTFRQTDENALAARITGHYKLVDDILGTFDQHVYPYDYSNNLVLDFDERSDGFGDKEQSHTDDEPGLERSVDDADLDFLGPRGAKRKSRQDSDDGLDFLNRYETTREEVKKIAANCSSAWKKRRVFDNPSFLEVY